MANNVEAILNEIEEVLDKSMGLPFSGGRCVVDVDKLRDLISDIRMNLPGEIRQAQNIVADRKKIVADAKAEAEDMIRRGEEKVRSMLASDELVKQAQARANDMVSQAASRTKEMKLATNEFVDRLLRETEESLVRNLAEIKKTRTAVKNIQVK